MQDIFRIRVSWSDLQEAKRCSSAKGTCGCSPGHRGWLERRGLNQDRDPELQKGRITQPFSLGQCLAGTMYRIVTLGAAEADETDFLDGLGHDLGTVKRLVNQAGSESRGWPAAQSPESTGKPLQRHVPLTLADSQRHITGVDQP
jgi:hypothetical protein